MSDRCLVCHTNIAAQKLDPTTMHGSRYKDNPDLPCWSCHVDHKGAKASLTDLKTAQVSHESTGYSIVAHQVRPDGSAFSCQDCHKTGYGNTQFNQDICAACHKQTKPEFMLSHVQTFGNTCLACHDGKDSYGHAFDHQKVPFQLTGKHAPVTCDKCHQNATSIAALQATSKDCISCHKKDNPHSTRIGTDCAACHKSDGWTTTSIDHNLTAFPLVDKHISVACEKCHANKVFIGTPTGCNSCHKKDDKHNGQYGPNCALCHNVKGWPTTINHNQFAFKLTGKHVTATCVSCHVNAVFKGTPADCASCHAKVNPHSSRLGTNCASCHTATAWLPASFDHNLATFALQGKHASVACTSCHINNVYRGTPSDCYSCHKKDDKHNGQYGTNCALCHTVNGWPTTFNHNLFTFQLTGKHAAVACASCHINGVFKGTPTDCASCHSKSNPHSSRLGTNCAGCHTTGGWLPATFNHNLAAYQLTGFHVQVACTACHINNVYQGTPTNCYACHAKNDKHNGQFGTGCSTCHTTNAWLPSTFDHNSSSFKLTGAHVQTPCASCHINGVFKGTPTNCYACHAKNDKHNGQLGTSCNACHTTNAWLPATFNHNTSSFPLTGAHVNVACSNCHANGVYKGTPTNCYACHAKNDHHNGQFGTNCGSCHSTKAWLPATFNHNTSSFPLTGAHVNVACSSCHANGVYKGTPTNCYACHAKNDKHNGQYGTNCSQCHSTNAWLPANFNHSNFPLTNGHAGVSCNSCHSSGKYSGLSTACSSCHNPPASHAGFGSNCTQCHTTSNWNSNFNHPNTCDGSCTNHHNATCATCHPNGYATATCKKCHSSNNPGIVGASIIIGSTKERQVMPWSYQVLAVIR